MKPYGVIVFVLLFVCRASVYAEAPVKIAAIYSMSGEAVAISIEHLVATRIALKEINASGGVLGRPIQLIELDNQSTSLGARNAAMAAVDHKVVAVVGGSWSSHAIGMGRVLQKAGIPMITPTATNPKVTEIGDFIFRTCFIDSYQGEMLARFAYEDLGVRAVAVLTNVDQIYAIDLSDQFIRKFKSMGGQLPARIEYIENLTQYKDLVQELMGHHFDAVMLPGYTRDSAHIIKTARNMGVETPFIGGDGWSHLMLNYASDELNDSYYLTHWYKGLNDDRSKTFMKKILEKFDETKVNAGMALAYDTLHLLADAIQRAGSPQPAVIRDALARTTDFVGVTGRIRYDQHRNPKKPAVILKFENATSILVKQTSP